MLNPQDLYEVEPDVPDLRDTVLVYELSGFMDAGSAGSLLSDHLLRELPNRVVARFDVDQLIDYRARRPTMTFAFDHWEDVETPQLAVHLLHDTDNVPFLLLRGPEPDLQWERFVAAVDRLTRDWQVRLVIGGHGIPVGAPHTRRLGVTAHATRAELVGEHEPVANRIQVPGNVAALLQLRLGQLGRDAAGFAVHVPHYLAQVDYPTAALRLLESVRDLTGLQIPDEALREAGSEVDAKIESQVRGSEQVTEVVKSLERQYDLFDGSHERSDTLVDPDTPMPTADELGAQFERFLAEQPGPGEQ